MKCSKAKRLISAYVDSELPDRIASELAAHLAVCKGCCDCERSLRRTADLMDQWQCVQPIGEFEGVMRRVEQPYAGHVFLLPLPGWAAAALAAFSLATGVVVGLNARQEAPPTPPTQASVMAAMGLDSFATNDLLEASIHEGVASGVAAAGKAVNQ